ncbi:hypothetical protein FW774_13730 [Pedobacter sp. BS3]|uniref:hypothetical protein n=1 Tax=Pedobacter sp. BS3 TaxID=2567937 RepID=UPI0011EE4319|nr:hypothetical protein [Pedobacter sp. BS3]TZF82565.1 hypothetical protein FW774_13730 [Pedobacter sp. BS3]
MNFLSHFYFDRYCPHPERVLGTVLPDLIKNANKSWIIHPNKHAEQLQADTALSLILRGWNRHLEVDKHFHNSTYFFSQTQLIKQAVLPVIGESPVRPSFLAHITLELLLDHLLITKEIVDAGDFYNYLKQVEKTAIDQFLAINGIDQIPHFFRFYDEFIRSAYLHRYSEIENITYSLNQICARLWKNPFTDTQKAQLSDVISNYVNNFDFDFMIIFEEIDTRLN